VVIAAKRLSRPPGGAEVKVAHLLAAASQLLASPLVHSELRWDQKRWDWLQAYRRLCVGQEDSHG